jgi:hypothetical protein
MRKFNVLMFLIFTLVIANFQSCKKSSLSEEDAIKLQQQTLVDYTVTLVSADNTHLISTSTKSASAVLAINGAIVKVTQDGVMVTKTADASGVLVFPNLKLGSASVQIKASGYSVINYVVDLLAMQMSYSSSHTSTYVSTTDYYSSSSTDQHDAGLLTIVGGSRLGNIIAMIPNSGTSMATIQGKVTYESDLTNIGRETVPASTRVLAILSGGNSNLIGNQADNYITSLSYDSLDMKGTTDATGNYSIKVPATADGLTYKLVVPDFSATQQIIMSTVNGDTVNSVQTIPTYFGTGFTSPSDIPATKPVTVTIAAPGYAYTPVAAAAVIDNTNGIENVQLVSNGAYYAAPGGGATYYTLTIDTPRISVSTFTKATGKATVQISVNADGRIIQTNVNAKGSKYLAAAENSDMAISYIQKACRATITTASNMTITIDNGGQFLSTSMDALEFYNISGTGTGAVYTPTFTWNGTNLNYELTSVTATGGNGYADNDVIGIRVKTAATSSQVTGKLHMTKGYVSAINITNEGANYKSGKVLVELVGGGGTDATASATVSDDGRVIKLDVTKGGTNYTSAPTVNVLSTVNNVTAKAVAVVNADGVITAINVVKAGDGYYTIPSVTINQAVPGMGSGAIVRAVIGSGTVTSITVSTGGSGYKAKNNPAASVEPNGKGVGNINVQTDATILGDIDLGTGKRTIEK